ncbi:MAG: lytic transglycosylase domain-containing protein [Burkholderiales bacterium]|nr:lytic transglycosylase domain-containing protein [Burkholderiales bacterium]
MLKYFLLVNFIMSTSYAINIDKCFIVASKQYQIPTKLLKAIAKTETRFDPLAVHVNSNHSYDIGMMQINSAWLPKLNKVGISEAELLDGCKNIQIGAWILAQNIKQYGFNSRAIGAYNATTSQLQEKYAQLVMKNIE